MPIILHPQKRPQGIRMTKKRRKYYQKMFLDDFAKHGVMAQACRVAGVDVSLLRYWRKDVAFEEAFQAAREASDDTLRYEVYRRAVEGVERPVYYQGEVVGHETVYSDRLLEFQAKARMPEYREKQQLEVSGTFSVIDLLRISTSEPEATEGEFREVETGEAAREALVAPEAPESDE